MKNIYVTVYLQELRMQLINIIHLKTIPLLDDISSGIFWTFVNYNIHSDIAFFKNLKLDRIIYLKNMSHRVFIVSENLLMLETLM